MASLAMVQTPQLEDGYTRLANELLEAVMLLGFTQRQLLVILAIIRKTYGYGKKEDDMSAAQIGQLCNMERHHVTEVIGQLVQMRVLNRREGKYGLVLGINKNHSQWIKPAPKRARGSPKLGLVEGGDSPNLGLSDMPKTEGSPNLGLVPTWESTSPNLGQVDSPNLGHTKENLSKETQKKRSPRQEVTFVTWIDDCKAKDKQPIPEDDSVFGYAQDVDLPVEFIRMAWVEFKRKYSESDKKYKDWPAHFRNAVRENWYGVWFEKNGNWELTTRGKQIQKELQVKR